MMCSVRSRNLSGNFPYATYSLGEVPDAAVNWYGIAEREISVEHCPSLFDLPDAQGYSAHEAGHAWSGRPFWGKSRPGWANDE